MRSFNLPYCERLDHLRFLAAFVVLSYHSFHAIYNYLLGPNASAHAHANALSVFVIEGQSAVGLFLTLSGFLFARICLTSNVDLKGFYTNRLLRIYPLFVSALVLAMCTAPSSASIVAFFTSLASFQFLPGALKGLFVDHLWSIGVEVQFYFLFPSLLLSYRKTGMRYLFQVIVLGVLLLAFIRLASGDVRSLSHQTILGRLNQAVIGMMVGFSFDRYRKYITSPIAFLAAVAITSCALLWLRAEGGYQGTADNPLWVFWPSLEALLWAAVICTYQACGVMLPSWVSRILAYLGSMSYSIYVVHYWMICALCGWFAGLLLTPHHSSRTVQQVQNLLLAHPLETSLWSGIFLILPPTLFLSWWTFNVIERPFMELRKKYTLPEATSRPAPAIVHGERELAYNR